MSWILLQFLVNLVCSEYTCFRSNYIIWLHYGSKPLHFLIFFSIKNNLFYHWHTFSLPLLDSKSKICLTRVRRRTTTFNFVQWTPLLCTWQLEYIYQYFINAFTMFVFLSHLNNCSETSCYCNETTLPYSIWTESFPIQSDFLIPCSYHSIDYCNILTNVLLSLGSTWKSFPKLLGLHLIVAISFNICKLLATAFYFLFHFIKVLDLQYVVQ